MTDYSLLIRGEVEVVETGALGASESRCDSCCRDHFFSFQDRKPRSLDPGLITLETWSITRACHQFYFPPEPGRRCPDKRTVNPRSENLSEVDEWCDTTSAYQFPICPWCNSSSPDC